MHFSPSTNFEIFFPTARYFLQRFLKAGWPAIKKDTLLKGKVTLMLCGVFVTI